MNLDPTKKTDEIKAARRSRGRPKKATNDRVKEAIKTLKAKNEEPSIDLVRSLTGGSDTTICIAIRELEEAEATVLANTQFPESLIRALKAYSDTSVVEVNQRWQQRFDEQRARCLALEKCAAQLELDNDDLHDEVEQGLRERDQEAGRSSLLREELNSRQQETATLRNQLVAAELRAGRADDERDAAIKRLDNQELASVKTSEHLDQHREVVANLREELGITKTHLEHARAQIKTLEAGSAHLPITTQRASGLQLPIRAQEASSHRETIKALNAIPRTDIPQVPVGDDDADDDSVPF